MGTQRESEFKLSSQLLVKILCRKEFVSKSVHSLSVALNVWLYVMKSFENVTKFHVVNKTLDSSIVKTALKGEVARIDISAV